MRVEWSQHAVADLKLISEYIEQDRSLEATNRVSRWIYDAVQSLRLVPYRRRPGRLNYTRGLVVRAAPYIIIYQIPNERLLMLNIVHGAQRWPGQGQSRTGYLCSVPLISCGW